MKSFEEIYEDLQNNSSAEFNEAFNEYKKKRQKANKISLAICIITDVLIITLTTIIICNLKPYSVIFAIMPAIMLAMFFNLFTYILVYISVGASKQQAKFNDMYKEKVIKSLINNFYNNLEYFPKKEMPEYIYKNLNYEYYDTYTSDDYFEALLDNKYSIQMAEIKTQEIKTERDSDGNTHTTYITKFHGLFSKIVLDKSIQSTLKIKPNNTIAFDSNKLDMDSSEFEKYFDVSASNKIIGMQLLTSDVMEDLINFRTKTNMNYEIYIINNELYLRFHSGEMFEARSISTNSLNKEEIEKYFYMLNFTYNLAKKLINVINEAKI